MGGSFIWGGLRGDRAAVADALLERQELWPNDAKKLLDVARGFEELAEAVGKGREPLSGEEQEERWRYRAESRRVAEAACRAATGQQPR
jgi:hypothetical protein